MFVVTFYSYKGGVGRTMALVNVAFTLATEGRRVLVIDFDLEAPGVETYPGLEKAAQHRGIVDYVSEYVSTGRAPNAHDFVVECYNDESSGGSVSVMPAGARDAGYAQRLSAINWLDLYQESDGYLMFEDLKQQLRDSFGDPFDYALIDSRTGHTDIKGICTRQLPDAVVLMFYPNDQNIRGVASTAAEIRAELPRRTIRLLFCPSNVPDLDDENDIVRRRLGAAERLLGYSNAASIVHNYQSLDLLDQKIFVRDRPKTKLADEYRALTAAITRLNIADKEGAIFALRDISRRYRGAGDEVHRPGELPLSIRRAPFLQEATEQIDSIQQHHPKDGDVAWELAELYRDLGKLESEYEALTIAIESQKNVAEAYRRRAINLLSQGELAAARKDVLQVLAADDASPVDLAAATELVRIVDPKNWVKSIREAEAMTKFDPSDQVLIANRLAVDVEGSRLAAQIVADLKDPGNRPVYDSNFEMLSLIGSGQFEAALKISQPRSEVLRSTDIEQVFNYAMAEWGYKRQPPVDLLVRVSDLDVSRRRSWSSNYHQCLGLVHSVLGHSAQSHMRLSQARELLGPGTVFSCWRYLNASRAEMLQDLDEMLQKLGSGPLHPPFRDRT